MANMVLKYSFFTQAKGVSLVKMIMKESDYFVIPMML